MSDGDKTLALSARSSSPLQVAEFERMYPTE
jgi:hypothetical protein